MSAVSSSSSKPAKVNPSDRPDQKRREPPRPDFTNYSDLIRGFPLEIMGAQVKEVFKKEAAKK